MVETNFVLGAFGFYVFLFVILGFVGTTNIDLDTGVVEEPSTTNILSQIGFFFQGLTFSIGALPAWANLLIFTPLAITLLYLITWMILELIPG